MIAFQQLPSLPRLQESILARLGAYNTDPIAMNMALMDSRLRRDGETKDQRCSVIPKNAGITVVESFS